MMAAFKNNIFSFVLFFPSFFLRLSLVGVRVSGAIKTI